MNSFTGVNARIAGLVYKEILFSNASTLPVNLVVENTQQVPKK